MNPSTAAASPSITSSTSLPPSYKWRVVGMLWLISVMNYADRQALASVFPLLQSEMGLSTQQLGLLGSAFAWLYGASAPLAGIIVDRVSRTRAVLFGLHAWSLICVATGAARNFWQLFLFRAAEGLGETFYIPASMSILSDYHGRRTRSRAMGLHQTSVYVGTVAGGFFAGLIGQHYGWRLSFYVFGGLGILLGFVLHRALVEPPRGAADQADAGQNLHHPIAASDMPYREFLRLLFSTPSAVLLMAAFICMNFVAIVLLVWMPKFLYDRFSTSLAEAGLYATLFAQAASMLGSPAGGWLADALRARAPGGRIYAQAIAAVCAVPFVFLCGQAGSLPIAILALSGWGLFKGFYDSNIWAALFDVIHPAARGRAVGLMNMVGWLGGGTAPVIIGSLAESRGLGAAIASAGYVYIAGAVILLVTARVFAPRDVRRMGQEVAS